MAPAAAENVLEKGQSQCKSSAADAQQSKDGAGKQRNLLRYCAAQQQLWGTHSCGKLATRASDRTGPRRKAPREHRGKCCGRAQQPRGQLTGCLWELPPAFARGSELRRANARLTGGPVVPNAMTSVRQNARGCCDHVYFVQQNRAQPHKASDQQHVGLQLYAVAHAGRGGVP